jgi:hypothetical protein
MQPGPSRFKYALAWSVSGGREGARNNIGFPRMAGSGAGGRRAGVGARGRGAGVGARGRGAAVGARGRGAAVGARGRGAAVGAGAVLRRAPAAKHAVRHAYETR